MSKVLIIEDDPAMLRGLKDNFEFEGYTVRTASNGAKGLDMAFSWNPDLILLDVMLPEVNGYEICRNLRQEKCQTPVVMLTAREQESDVILGLKLGADDYVTKPFSIKELLARCEAVLRRRGVREVASHSFGTCVLDVAARRFSRAGEVVKLSPREFDLLQFFCENRGKALSRERIMSEVWGYGSIVTPRSIDRFVTTLRGKIEPDPQQPEHIHTLQGFGYRFEE